MMVHPHSCSPDKGNIALVMERIKVAAAVADAEYGIKASIK